MLRVVDGGIALVIGSTVGVVWVNADMGVKVVGR